jgi:hypothetical protein
MTGYAVAKYGLILLIVIIILYFIAVYLLPGGDEAPNEVDEPANGDDGLPEPTTPGDGDGNGEGAPGTSGLPLARVLLV